MRWILGVAGLSALGAATLMSVVNVGGLYAPMAPGIIAMTVILAVGSAAVSFAHAQGSNAIAVILALCMLLSESGAGLMTARRVMENREALRAPVADLAAKREAAAKALAIIEAEKPASPDESRLGEAERAKGAAETAVRNKAADKGCRENCRLLLQSAVDAAQLEVAAARLEFDILIRRNSQRHEERLSAARAALATLPPARSATPLSDETGVPEWALDIWEALALSIGLNIPGSLLIALAVNTAPTRRPPASETEGPDRASVIKIDIRPVGKVATFMLACAEPSTGGRIEIADLFTAYRNWCRENAFEALRADAFGDALRSVIERAEIEAVRSRGRVFLVGLALSSNTAFDNASAPRPLSIAS